MNFYQNLCPFKIFVYNQNSIISLEAGATIIINIEIWKSFIEARDEVMIQENKEYEDDMKFVKKIINELNRVLTFNSKIEATITKVSRWKHQARK